MAEKIKKTGAIVAILVAISVAVVYLLSFLLLPKILNSKNFINTVERILNKKIGLSLEIKDYNFQVEKALFVKFYAKNITLKNQDKNLVLSVENVNSKYKPFNLKSSFIEADNIFFDKTKLDKKDKNRKDKSYGFNFKNLPNIQIKNADLILDDKNSINVNISNLRGFCENNRYVAFLSLKINSSFSDFPIETKENTKLIFDKNKINFEDFELLLDNTPVSIKGFYSPNNKYSLKILSNNLSIPFIQKTFLYFMKQKEPNNKNFIENFYDFKGLGDIDLTFQNGSIDGEILLKKFSAKYVKFSIPLYFESAKFHFNKDKITLSEFGKVGEQRASAEFSAEKLFSKEKIIKGNLKTTANSDFAKKYIKNLKITGNIDLSIEYNVFNKEITVEYLANLPKNSGINYNNADLVQKHKNRRLYAKTFKKGNTMYLEDFKYSVADSGKLNDIFIGSGQFDRFNNKYHLNYVSCKTAEPVPVSLFAFFDKLIKGGYFEGDVNYSAKNKILTGKFNLYDTKYKNFYVKSAKVNADSSKIRVNGSGTFENEPFSAYLDMDNTLYDNIKVNDVNLYLKKYEIKRSGKSKKTSSNPQKIVNKVKEADITIKKGTVKLDKLIFKNIVLENLLLEGLIDNNIAFFDMSDIDFAKGKLSARGIYDLETKSSDIDFTSSNVDSNIASNLIFNLENQFEGFANASLNFKSFNNLEIVDANANFSIHDGALTKLGSKEFLIKKSKDSSKVFKFKLTDILNINEKQIKSIRSDLNGNFALRNYQIKNAEIFTKQKSVSVYLKGNYNIKTQYADVNIFGRYDRNAQKGIRVLFVPLSIITKVVFKKSDSKNIYFKELSKIPAISGKEEDKETFVVKLQGNPNKNSTLHVEIKSLK